MAASIELMSVMNEKGGSNALYDAVCEWHRKNIGSKETIESEKLHQKLVDRYNLQPIMPFEIKIEELPHTKESAGIACNDSTAMIVDLLTDPRLGDADYLFNGNDPMAGIPESFEEVGDVNTGLAYRKTYEELIEPAPYTEGGRRRVFTSCDSVYGWNLCRTVWLLPDGIPQNHIGNFQQQIPNKELCLEESWVCQGYKKEQRQGSEEHQKFLPH